MSSTANPWLISPDVPTNTEADLAPAGTKQGRRIGATAPQPGIALPDTIDCLPQRHTSATATLWWLGVHGGAGESSLAAITAGTRAANHAWPIPDSIGTTHRVVLVARTNYSGLIAAQRAATEWAANTLADGIELHGLALIADAPGRRPKELRHLEQVIAGGVPQVWNLPWVDAWRLGPATADAPLPKEFQQLFTDLSLPLPHLPHHN